MTIDKQCDIHAEEVGAAAKLEEAREMAVKAAVEALWSNPKGVSVGREKFMDAHTVMCLVPNYSEYLEEPEAVRSLMTGNPEQLRDLYNEVAYNMLYPHADFLISNNSQPF